MLSSVVARSASRLTVAASKSAAVPRVIAARGFTIGGTFGKKEKVEEDRYMREQEKKFFERKKQEMSDKMKEEDAAIFEETIAPAMAEAHVRLEKSGDSVSDAGLEALARWKLDMEE